MGAENTAKQTVGVKDVNFFWGAGIRYANGYLLYTVQRT